jgi:hypothetical protein
MSIKRINEFPEGSGVLSSDDVFLFMDDPSGGGTTKKISLSEISSSIFDQDLNTFNNVAFNQIAIGGSSGSSYYVMANVDGNTVTSLDGLNWNGPYDLNMEIGHVATNGTTIVTIGGDNDIGYTSFSSPSGATIVAATVSGITNIDLNQIIYGGGYFVVAGKGNDGIKNVPLYGYSSDGSNWTFKIVTGELATTLADGSDADCEFSDIDYNGIGWNFAIADTEQENTNNIGGGVYTTDITETFDDSNYFSMVPAMQAAWNGNAWYYINSDQGSGFNANTDPRIGEWDGPYNPWESSQEDLGINITDNISDTFCGGNGYLVFSDSNGHISFSNDNGQHWTYVTPIPYTATITDISYVDNKYQISVTGEYTDHADGEKITISGSSVTGYNGVYFLDNSNFLYTDFELTTPWTSEIAAFSGTANLAWSHGQYIDAMDYTNGYFYIGNDDEQIARSDDLSNWTIVDDRDNAFQFWNDFNGYSSNSDGNLTISSSIGGPTIQAANGKSLTLISSGSGEFGEVGTSLLWVDNLTESTKIAAVVANNPLYVGDGDVGIITGNFLGGEGSDTNVWSFNTDGNLTLPSGSIISEINNTVSIMPPTALSGQSLVIRPTMATWSLDSSGYIVYGSSITVSVTLQSWAYFGTVNYTFTGNGVTEQSLGRALTGKLTFVSTTGPDTETITWTMPSNSNITEFTLTLTSVDGTRSTNIETENNPALYYSFEENAMPIGQFITVTNNGISNSEHSHVHLVAGNPETVDIYLGDDDQYIKIEKDGGDVVIGTNFNNNQWTFGADGILTLPASGSITFPDNTIQTSAGIPSSTGLVPNSVSITNIVSMSQANYDALVTKNSSTLYVIS